MSSSEEEESSSSDDDYDDESDYGDESNSQPDSVEDSYMENRNTSYLEGDTEYAIDRKTG